MKIMHQPSPLWLMVNPHEGISDVGRKRSSQGSSKSGGSSTASARLRAQADKAALKARSSALKERRALEEQQLRREREAAWLGSRSGCSHCWVGGPAIF